MSNQKRFVKIAVIVTVFVLSGVFGYMEFTQKRSDRDIVGNAQSSVQGTQKVDEMSNWKTYRNEKYGFEIKIPLDWKIVNDSNGNLFLGVDIGHNFYSGFDIATSSISSDEIAYNMLKENFSLGFGNDMELVKKLRFEDGKLFMSFSAPSGLGSDIWIIDDENKSLIFTTSAANFISDGELDENGYQKVISTFKFTK